MIDDIIKVASRMYGISLVKSKLLVEKLLKENSGLTEGEILKSIGEQSLFYLAK